jgi:CheY-like chemotaxis protein
MSIGVALVVSQDARTIAQVSNALRQLSISPDVCGDQTTAVRLLDRRKCDAVIVDLQLGDVAGIPLDQARRSTSNRRAVTFAITDGNDSKEIFRSHANFAFDRPLSERSIYSTLKAAYGLILRERRRYFRCPVSIPVVVHRQAMSDVYCYAHNISEGGMALSTIVSFSPGEEVRVEFTLPETKTLYIAGSTICWLRTGHLGLRFTALSEALKSELQERLSQKLEELLPEYVAKKFQKTGRSIDVNSLTPSGHNSDAGDQAV